MSEDFAIDRTPPSIPYLEFLGILGEGGMAVVWKARHLKLGRILAVKVLREKYECNPEDVEQFTTEGRALAFLSNPGFVKGYGVDCHEGRHFYLMEYIDGYTFNRYLKHRNKISESDSRIVLTTVAQALNYAWSTFHTIHCDLKPDNLMVSSDGQVKITDLGLAHEVLLEKHERRVPGEDDEVIGTPAYMSPEQILGNEVLDCRSDIYSLGATIYHFVTGRVLYDGLSADDMILAHVDMETQAPDPRVFAPDLSDSFVCFLACMLVKQRDGRYADWEELLNSYVRMECGGGIPIPNSEAVCAFKLNEV